MKVIFKDDTFEGEKEFEVHDIVDLSSVMQQAQLLWWQTEREKLTEQIKDEMCDTTEVKERVIENLTDSEREEIADNFVYEEFGYDSVDEMNDKIDELKGVISDIHEVTHLD